MIDNGKFEIIKVKNLQIIVSVTRKIPEAETLAPEAAILEGFGVAELNIMESVTANTPAINIASSGATTSTAAEAGGQRTVPGVTKLNSNAQNTTGKIYTIAELAQPLWLVPGFLSKKNSNRLLQRLTILEIDLN